MSTDPRTSASEAPRSEPEILPPLHAEAKSRSDHTIWVASEGRGARRIYVAKLGPFSLFLLSLGIVFLSLCVIVLVAGAILIWIPVVGVLVFATIIAALLRKSFRH